MRRCWLCGPGSAWRAANVAKYLVLFRDGGLALMCRRHAVLQIGGEGIVLELGSLPVADLQ